MHTIYSRRRFLGLAGAGALLGGCRPGSAAAPAAAPTGTPDGPAFFSGVYRNLFAERGKTPREIADRVNAAWQSLFASADDSRRVYYPAGENERGPLAYVKDIGNGDIRSEGMSYGMMIAVQLDHQPEFDALWNWAITYMRHADGDWAGYFSWHNREDGTRLDDNPASDGEEWFAMALFFAAGRWGSSPRGFDYLAEANAVLNVMLHKADMLGRAALVTSIFNREQQQVVFVPYGAAATFTDPSYHLPAYYELWHRWAAGYQQQDADRAFWAAAARTSRDFFQKTSHPTTGLAPDYANFDGTPTGGRWA